MNIYITTFTCHKERQYKICAFALLYFYTHSFEVKPKLIFSVSMYTHSHFKLISATSVNQNSHRLLTSQSPLETLNKH